jgi:hypothetical protein
MFTAGLLDSRMKLAAYPNVGGFIFVGTDHTTLGNSCTPSAPTNCFDGRTANAAAGDAGTEAGAADGGDAGAATGTVALTDWVATLVNTGTVTNVGP